MIRQQRTSQSRGAHTQAPDELSGVLLLVLFMAALAIVALLAA